MLHARGMFDSDCWPFVCFLAVVFIRYFCVCSTVSLFCDEGMNVSEGTNLAEVVAAEA